MATEKPWAEVWEDGREEKAGKNTSTTLSVPSNHQLKHTLHSESTVSFPLPKV